jgi:hypothetical protein
LATDSGLAPPSGLAGLAPAFDLARISGSPSSRRCPCRGAAIPTPMPRP